MGAASVRTKSRTYALLLLMQTLAVVVLLAGTLPIYLELLALPGRQLAVMPQSPVLLVAALLLFHCAYWFRLTRVPIVVRRHNLVLSHLVLFIARLSFIFGAAFFGLIAFRHLPSLAEVTDTFMLVMRLGAALIILFSLYCYSTELERLGQAIRPPSRD
ncbi:MAG: hypothetical protein ACK4UO_18565 [Pseudolabrys sp.]